MIGELRDVPHMKVEMIWKPKSLGEESETASSIVHRENKENRKSAQEALQEPKHLLLKKINGHMRTAGTIHFRQEE